MLDPAIKTFLNERRLLWLSKKIKGNITPEDKKIVEKQSLEAYSLHNWLFLAAQRAYQLSASTHPGKFSHPDVKINPIIAKSGRSADGFLRSGNVSVIPDVYGNAAALDVYKFLNLRLADGETIMSHLERQSSEIKAQFDLPEAIFNTITAGLFAIKKTEQPIKNTSGKLKQVYFPVDAKTWHLLSILTPSSLVFKLKERINSLRFSLHARTACDAQKNNQFFAGEFSEIVNLTLIRYGGTKPQNISVLNNENGGTAYLLPSMPPSLFSDTLQPPKTCFFESYLEHTDYQDIFEAWHHQKMLLRKNKTAKAKKAYDQCIQNIIYRIADTVWQIRQLKAGWSLTEAYRHLPRYQKFWLDQRYVHKRKIWPNYLVTVKQDSTGWFLNQYTKILGDRAFNVEHDERKQIYALIDRCEEALR